MTTHGIVTEGVLRTFSGRVLDSPRKHGWRLDPEKIERQRHEREARMVAEMDAANPKKGVCYFIGFSRGVHRRVAELRATSIFKLHLLATANGGRAREMYYHRRFAAHAVGREWFARCPEIEAEIARLSSPAPFAAGGAL